MAKSKPKKAAAKPAKAKAAKPKPKAKTVKAKPAASKAVKSKKAAPKAKPKTAKSKTAAKPKTVKKTKTKTKPKKGAVKKAAPSLAASGATPTINSPSHNSSQPSGQNLTVNVGIDTGNIRYRIEFTDISGSPPFPAPFTVDTAVGARIVPFNATIPGSEIAPGKTYQILVMVHPDDGSTPPHNTAQITITTP